MDEKATRPLFDVIFQVVRSIPVGMVATYGQIAAVVGRCSPLMVGYAMAAVPFDSDVPWHRVVNHQGRISSRGNGDGEQMQRVLLEAEGIHFDKTGRIDLNKDRWVFPVK
jgi:methylated-DNA-protein-cysteine methyltransferase related protein